MDLVPDERPDRLPVPLDGPRPAGIGVRVLFVTNMWPDPVRPWYGSFVRSQADSLRELGLDVVALPIRGYAGRRAYLMAARAMASRPPRGFDIVHAHYGHSGVVARLQRAAPLVVSFCGDDLLGTVGASGTVTRRSGLEARVFRQLARVCDATITKSDEMARRLPESCRPRNRVIPNGVDLERFKRVPRVQARRTLRWSTDEAVVLFVGNPQLAVKNFALAQATVEHIRGEVPCVRLHVVWGARPEEIPMLMSAADALLVTSRSEGSPNVVKEAMASELPVVSTPVGDVEARLEGVAGCHVRIAQPDLLGGALVSALRHGRAPEARRAVEAVSMGAVARRVLAVYEGVRANRAREGRLVRVLAAGHARSTE